MRYESFKIINYKGIIESNININSGLSPFIGVNESGKSTILEAIASFDKDNDILYDGQFINNDLIISKFNRRDNPKIIA
ncbi:MAG: AAA family ATPase, partial [Veillonella sp.]|nr:AAA family ATPase [Veillonella sp.]